MYIVGAGRCGWVGHLEGERLVRHDDPTLFGAYDLDEKIKVSRGVLKEVLERKDPDLPLVVNFSGGKDSSACVLLAKEMTDNIELLYMDAGFDLPETLPYARQQAERLGLKLHVTHPSRDIAPHPRGGIPQFCDSLVSYVSVYGYWPTAHRRWCSYWLKHIPARVHWRKHYGKASLYKIAGMRQTESAVRGFKYGSRYSSLKYGDNGHRYIRPDDDHSGSFVVLGILDWDKEDVEEYLKRMNWEVHSGYKVYGVSGCAWCPVHTPDIFENILKVHPNIYDDIIATEELIEKPSVRGGVWLGDIKERGEK